MAFAVVLGLASSCANCRRYKAPKMADGDAVIAHELPMDIESRESPHRDGLASTRRESCKLRILIVFATALCRELRAEFLALQQASRAISKREQWPVPPKRPLLRVLPHLSSPNIARGHGCTRVLKLARLSTIRRPRSSAGIRRLGRACSWRQPNPCRPTRSHMDFGLLPTCPFPHNP